MSKKYFETIRDKLIYDAGKLKVSLVSVKDEGKINGKRHLSLSAKKCNPPSGESIKISGGEELLQEIDLNKNHYQIWIKRESVTRFLECFFDMLKKAGWDDFKNSNIILSILKNKNIDPNQLEELFSNTESLNKLIHILKTKTEGKKLILDCINEGIITDQDFVNIAYRKEQLEVFKNMLEQELIEKDWQSFFEKNQWIFGYGLDYRFIESSNREVSVGYGDIDFASFNKFSVLVEIKTPQTPLLKKPAKDEKSPNRVDAWSLSDKLIEAMSQILAYKANWQIESEYRENKEKFGNDFLTADPRAILVIGKFCDLDKNVLETKNKRITKETFELFRRDSRNVEIITFDELYERAKFIVEDKTKKEKKNFNNNINQDYQDLEDDMPF